MRNFYASITAVLCWVCRPVFALNCDISLLSNAGIAIAGPPTVDHLKAGTTITLEASPGCASSFVASTDMCRVTMNVVTSPRSSIYMELWLPDTWDGRYISTGNFGINGCVLYEDLKYFSSLQLAVGGANGGHAGDSGQYFANNIDVITDYSFRSVHNMTTISKQLAKTYYSSAPNKSYYYGCSTGGRQGLQSAQMFPDDFDGIIASSAAADFNGLTGWSGNFFVMTGSSGAPTFLTETQWSTVATAVMSACDGIDNVIDSIIEDPDLCKFDPNTLQCSAKSDPNTCLTSAQVQTVTAAFSALRDTNGKLIYPAMQPGVEKDAFGFYFSGHANPIPSQWYQNAILNNQNYDPAKLSIADIVHGQELDLAKVSSFSGDLSGFKNKGGKLITTHGLADAIITSTNSERYYKHVSATMNLSPDALDDFFRYFRISGMGHCGGGNGAWEIGQTGADVPANPQQNVLFALFDWVENGKAPNALLGTKFTDDKSANGVSFQRSHCRFPYRTTFNGGDATKPGSWICTPIMNTNVPMTEEI